jgi:hypothetical protein
VALDRWVTEGAEPPPSQVPTVAGDTLASPERLAFPAVPGMAVARETNQLVVYGDWIDPRPEPAKSYRVLVPRVDGDGNEVAGIRLPDIAVPLATYTGWNLYKAPFPEGELCDRDGSFVPFATTRAERERRGDPRLSLEERYGSVDAYARRVEAVVAELVKARLLLPEDAERYVAASKARPAF